MLRYRYNQQVTPPAPFVYIDCQRPLEPTERLTLPALVDTGADLSTLPSDAIQRLQLVPLDEIPVASYRGETVLAATYLTRMHMGSWTIDTVEIIAGGEEYAILGRDVLNQFSLVLDGPHSVLEIRKD
jgi:predicted aspartyl protease